MARRFAVVTTDGSVYVQGDRYTWPEIWPVAVVLEGYGHEGDYVALFHASGVTVAFPEHRVARIVYRDDTEDGDR